MPQTITTGYRALVDAAEREIELLTVEQALALFGRDDVTFIDIRDVRELEREGRVPGAFHCPRGMLDSWIDPESPYHKPVFAADQRFVFFCAGGLRSALAARTGPGASNGPASRRPHQRRIRRVAQSERPALNCRQPSQAPPSSQIRAAPRPRR